jgi:thymidylate synthase ThyX
MAEEFTEQEEAVLALYVTNTKSNVFVLRNLPEVIKGALFSRYSRSTKSLRRLLLDEFINNPETGFAAVREHVGEDKLALQKAEAFYDRILDGYGDDSVAELGGVHLALENISNIATKTVQDLRIGGSPLEKSSRYVWFNQKVDGRYQYLVEPTLQHTNHKQMYDETNNLLFGTYDELVEPMKSFFTERIPKDEKTPVAAYNASIRAQACDVLRGLLPASTLTNMGVFGNGRFFEYLLFKLRTHPLAEMHSLADQIQNELDKVVPSFVRRGKKDHRHFIPSAEFVQNSTAALQQAAKNIHVAPVRSHTVELIDFDAHAEEKVLATLLYPHSDLSLHQLRTYVKTLSGAQRKELLNKVFSHRTNRRHKPPRAFENAYYTFDILADFGAYRDLQRHRMLTQERQDLTVQHGYSVPAEIIEAGYEEKWHACMRAAAHAYTTIAATHPKEAQYVVPLAYNIRWYFTINVRGLYWITEIRSAPQGHPSYRAIAQQLYLLAKQTHPLLFEYAAYVDMNKYALGRLQAETKQAQKSSR